MKQYRLINVTMFTLFLLVLGMFTACSEDINVGNKVDENGYETSDKVAGYLIGADGKKSTTYAEFRDAADISLYLALNKNATQAVSATLKFDASVLEQYNTANGTNYALFPQASVSFANGGAVSVSNGTVKSDAVVVSVTSDGTLSPETTYVIPVSTSLNGGDILLGEESTLLIFVKDLSQIPTADKASGIKIISCMEVNDTNPLNNLCFTLNDSGKPLVDILILFSGNVNYDETTGRVYNYNNPNVQHLLDNREKYLKPLQDRGIKVVLGILGNHDRSGVANMPKETAQAFAQELKAVCDAYNLDGIFWDDEYSSYQTPPPPGFVSPSSAAAARLCYECKQAMPDKLMCAYVYGLTRSFPSVDGVPPGDFVDWGIHDYGGSSDLSGNYPGLAKSGMALYSQEFAQGRTTTEANLRRLRNDGYGGNMIFAMDPFRSNFNSSQLPAMQRMARVLFDEELVYDGQPYAKDW